jgi:endonuclease YncB( thermonuclease family)
VRGAKATPLIIALLSTATHADVTGTASVIDGDTLEIHGQRIRLHGIDAPESGQTCEDAAGRHYRCGQKAALALSDKIGRSPVECRAGRRPLR